MPRSSVSDRRLAGRTLAKLPFGNKRGLGVKVVLACICRAHGGAAQAHRLRWPSPYGDMLKGLLPGLARPAAFAHVAHAWNRLAGMTWLRLV